MRLLHRIICVLALLLLSACDKENSFTLDMRIASYYGFMFDGESSLPHRMLLGYDGRRWEQRDPIEGFDYEEGFEYEIKVRVKSVKNPPMGGSSRTMSLIKVVSKVKKQTDDCPLQSWDEFIAEHPEHPEWAESDKSE